MVDSQRVAVMDGIQDLEKDTLDQGIIPDKVALVSDAREQVAFRAEFYDDIGAVVRVHNAH